MVVKAWIKIFGQKRKRRIYFLLEKDLDFLKKLLESFQKD